MGYIPPKINYAAPARVQHKTVYSLPELNKNSIHQSIEKER